MALRRRKKDEDRPGDDPRDEAIAGAVGHAESAGGSGGGRHRAATATAPADETELGPFDIEDFDSADQALVGRLDLGSVLIPMPAGGQVQVELSPTGVPSAIWVVTANGRFTIAAYAAPKSPGLWREVAGELAEALRNDNASVSIQDGPWGREVVGTGAGAVRFIGLDGYRWMVRCVVNGAPETMDALTSEARAALADTVIRRGDTALPVRTPLPVQLPEELANQLRAAAAQQMQQAQQAQQAMLAAQQAMLHQQAHQQAGDQAGQPGRPIQPGRPDQQPDAGGADAGHLRSGGAAG